MTNYYFSSCMCAYILQTKSSVSTYCVESCKDKRKIAQGLHILKTNNPIYMNSHTDGLCKMNLIPIQFSQLEASSSVLCAVVIRSSAMQPSVVIHQANNAARAALGDWNRRWCMCEEQSGNLRRRSRVWWKTPSLPVWALLCPPGAHFTLRASYLSAS